MSENKKANSQTALQFLQSLQTTATTTSTATTTTSATITTTDHSHRRCDGLCGKYLYDGAQTRNHGHRVFRLHTRFVDAPNKGVFSGIVCCICMTRLADNQINVEEWSGRVDRMSKDSGPKQARILSELGLRGIDIPFGRE